MKLYETKTIENALFLVFCCLIPVNKTMKPVTQISAIGDEKNNIENFRVKTNNAVWGVH